ncbi:MAG: 50S ribosomal protein L29 [Spirosomataceae bacterium]
MKKIDYSGQTVEQLYEHMAVETDRLQKLKCAHAISPLENPTRVKASRREIARLMTELNAR